MKKFKAGDLVIGNYEARIYGLTTTGTKWKIYKPMDEFGYITVIGLPGTLYDDELFEVEAICFDLVKPKDRKEPKWL